MNEETLSVFQEHLQRMWCPRCHGDLELRDGNFFCAGCAHDFESQHNIPLLFCANEWSPDKPDVSADMKAFYEETPFPNYEEFDSVASLMEKARLGIFAKLLEDQVPPGARILECGCGTGQLSNFLSIANRTVFGTDMCVNSLGLAQGFKEASDLKRAHFLQMNLFRPVFRPGSFDLVISNGVLHHTSDPRLAFQSIAPLVRRGGFILVGLYHRYGRLITDARRAIFRAFGDRFTFLDPNLRGADADTGRFRAWFRDQYNNPHESKHTMGEVIRWLPEAGCRFVKSIPRSKPFQPIGRDEPLFQPEAPGNALERAMVELGMIRSGSREGGFFIVVGQRTVSAADQNSV